MTSNRKKIVIIDDFDFFLTSFRKQLEDKYDVYTAQNFKDFSALLENIKPDLLILDIEMPGFNGFDIFRMIRDKHHYDYVPILYLSQIDDEKIIKKAMSLGADNFLHKSISKENLIKRIEDVVSPRNKKRDEPSVLVVDEDVFVLYTICNSLKGKCKVYALSNPADIYGFLKKTSPDLFLLDYKLFKTPESNIFSTLLDYADNAESSFIFLITDEAADDVSREYVTLKKPLDELILRESVSKCLEGYKTRRVLRSITSNQS
jgi:PleD family two-component response regulator